ncbi:ATP-binding protein [Qipengyuania sp. 902]|uniref:ATP-binding protein n=1 Tax=Qipengyuania sp. 902 TaxID=3417565 RepID=UPI003EBA81E1
MDQTLATSSLSEAVSPGLRRMVAIHTGAALAFFALAYVSIDFARNEGRIAAIWLPNAVAVAILLRFRFEQFRSLIGAIFVGNVVANIASGDPIAQALLLASANGIEIALAVWLTRRWCWRQPIMEDIDDLRRFAIASGMIAPAASGLIAILAFGAQPATLLAVYSKWVTSDALSMLILAPSIMIAIDALRTRRKLRRRELAEWVGLSLAGTALTIVVFVQTTYPLLFLVPPVVVIHAFRLGSLGTAFSTIKVAVIALVCTELGHGPINLLTYPETIRFLVLEAFLASAILLGLPVSAVLATRQRFAAELAAQKAELALLAENVTDAILRVDGEGVITYASPSVMAVLGLPPEQFIGKRVSERVHADAADEIAAVEHRLNSGEAEKERFTYRRYLDGEDGEAVYIEADCAVARDAETGEQEGIVVSARDVTHRVLLERQLKGARSHAENAARAKAQFLANMSHEIRTPMNGVLGFAELLQRRDLDAESARYAELIERSGRSMMMLLNDILDLSKIESGQLKVTSEPVNVVQLSADCVELHRAQAECKGVSLSIAPVVGIPQSVSSDPLRLRQIMLNLIGNAVKFTESGGIKMAVAREQTQLAISVEDSGIGIDESRLAMIFDPFVQAEGSTTRRFGGTGLGLSVSRQLAELLGGSLSVDSMPGIGSRFTLCIPLVEVETVPARQQGHGRRATDIAMPPKGRILLAEDHDVNRMLVTAMLEDLGQEVTHAHDGVAAIEAVTSNFGRRPSFDLVLMDIQMPGCDGYAAARAIRSYGIEAEHLPIVALTANAYPEDVLAAQIAGMQAHLAKPLVFEDLAAALARWLPMHIVADNENEKARIRRPDPGAATLPPKSSDIDERWKQRRSEAIEAVGAAVRAQAMEGAGIEDLARVVHKLAGTAGMFGEEELGSRAAALERALRSSVDVDVRLKLAEELLEAA